MRRSPTSRARRQLNVGAVNIVVNGKAREVPEGSTVAQLIETLGHARAQRRRRAQRAPDRPRDAAVGDARGGRRPRGRSTGAGRMNGAERRAALEQAKLYLVAAGELPTDVLQSVIEAGVDVVQLRMKDAEAAEVIEIGDQFRGVCEAAGVPFVVNDRPDIALALGADGVHLGQDDLPPSVAREIVGPDVVIGRSTHSTADIDRRSCGARSRAGRLHRRRTRLRDADETRTAIRRSRSVARGGGTSALPVVRDRRHQHDERRGPRRRWSPARRRRPGDH